MKRIRLCFTLIIVTLLLCLPTYAGNWVQDNYGWWYQNDDGTYPTNSWLLINGNWYYFDSRGYMAADCWIGDYYVGSSGAMLTNAYAPDGRWLDATGKVSAAGAGAATNYPSGYSSSGAQTNTNTQTQTYSGSAGKTSSGSSSSSTRTTSYSYIGNANSMKFHRSTCASAKRIADHNKVYLDSREDAINRGYVPCKNCRP